MSKILSTQLVKLVVQAGKAAPAPPVGPALGQKGVKAVDFCKQFNDRTKSFVVGTPMTTHISIKPDKTFTFVVKTPPTVWLLKKAAGVSSGSPNPSSNKVGTLSLKHIYEIAKIKHTDPELKELSLEAVTKSVIGVARGIGLDIHP